MRIALQEFVVFIACMIWYDTSWLRRALWTHRFVKKLMWNHEIQHHSLLQLELQWNTTVSRSNCSLSCDDDLADYTMSLYVMARLSLSSTWFMHTLIQCLYMWWHVFHCLQHDSCTHWYNVSICDGTSFIVSNMIHAHTDTMSLYVMARLSLSSTWFIHTLIQCLYMWWHVFHCLQHDSFTHWYNVSICDGTSFIVSNMIHAHTDTMSLYVMARLSLSPTWFMHTLIQCLYMWWHVFHCLQHDSCTHWYICYFYTLYHGILKLILFSLFRKYYWQVSIPTYTYAWYVIIMWFSRVTAIIIVTRSLCHMKGTRGM